MIAYDRPRKPSNFDSGCASAVAAIQALIDPATGQPLAGFASGKFDNQWGQHKDVFNTAQHTKCAYCERVYTDYGEVEHVLPKAEVAVLHPSNQGNEMSTLRVTGRQELSTVIPGYWWQAYNWKNYCFSCNHCNSKWKKNFLVVNAPHTTQDIPTEGRTEVILFIHPYDVDPEDHLSVDEAGIVKGLTPLGKATIETLGLWRPSLIQHRHDAYTAAKDAADLFLGGRRELDGLKRHMLPSNQQTLARRCAIRHVLGEDSYLELKAQI